MSQTTAELIVSCLENEGVTHVFGLPGEENIYLLDALSRSDIRFILVRHEQGASFMAELYGRLTGKAGVCVTTLGPGSINLLLGVTDAFTNSTPVVAISAQVGLNRIFKESHQNVRLQSLYEPVTKWADTLMTSEAAPEMIRKAFQLAQTERPGSTFLAIPQNFETEEAPDDARPLPVSSEGYCAADPHQIEKALELIREARYPVVLAGYGTVRAHAGESLQKFIEKFDLPVATTFMAKGIVSDKHPNTMGTVGYTTHDYENFAFDKADLIISIGFELQEFDPVRINPAGDKPIIHIHHFMEDVDKNYPVAVNVIADIPSSLDALTQAQPEPMRRPERLEKQIREDLHRELEDGSKNSRFPLRPERLIADIRQVMQDDDIVLADTGAIKMWMARLYPTYLPSTCLITNGLSTMSFALPGALGARIACPDKRILAVMGDGSFLMNSQELETAIREKLHFVVLVWVDENYGLIKWNMDRKLGHDVDVHFNNPDFVQYAESFGAIGKRVDKADDLIPMLNEALDYDGITVIACPVDYSVNLQLSETLESTRSA